MNRIQFSPLASRPPKPSSTSAPPGGTPVPASQSDIDIDLFVPLNYEPGYRYPLVVWLGGDCSPSCDLPQLMRSLSMRNYVAAAPQGSGRSVSSSASGQRDGDEFFSFSKSGPAESEPTQSGPAKSRAPKSGVTKSGEMQGHSCNGPVSQMQTQWPQTPRGCQYAWRAVEQSIELAQQRYRVDLERILLAGYGSGGTMAFRLAFSFPQRLMAVASLSGPVPVHGAPLANLLAARRLPVFWAHSRHSRQFPEATLCAQLGLLHAAGFSLTLRQYPGDDRLHSQMLHDLNVWMMELATGRPDRAAAQG